MVHLKKIFIFKNKKWNLKKAAGKRRASEWKER